MNSLEGVGESIDKISELARVRKILAKDRGVTEEPMQLLTGDLTRTPKEPVGILLDAHFLGARITSVPKTEPKPLGSSTTDFELISEKFFRPTVGVG